MGGGGVEGKKGKGTSRLRRGLRGDTVDFVVDDLLPALGTPPASSSTRGSYRERAQVRVLPAIRYGSGARTASQKVGEKNRRFLKRKK